MGAPWGGRERGVCARDSERRHLRGWAGLGGAKYKGIYKVSIKMGAPLGADGSRGLRSHRERRHLRGWAGLGGATNARRRSKSEGAFFAPEPQP